MRQSLHIIKTEHRNLFRVVHVLDHLMRDLEPGGEPDFELLKAIIEYIETFVDTYHHPKEDQYLFKALRRRDPSAGPILDELEAEHTNCPVSLKVLREALDDYQASFPEGRKTFQRLATDYMKFQTKHLQKEEGVVLPLAQRHLTDEDWAEIDAAFTANDDPVFGAQAQAETRRLYTRVVNAAPAPFGFGD